MTQVKLDAAASLNSHNPAAENPSDGWGEFGARNFRLASSFVAAAVGVTGVASLVREAPIEGAAYTTLSTLVTQLQRDPHAERLVIPEDLIGSSPLVTAKYVSAIGRAVYNGPVEIHGTRYDSYSLSEWPQSSNHNPVLATLNVPLSAATTRPTGDGDFRVHFTIDVDSVHHGKDGSVSFEPVRRTGAFFASAILDVPTLGISGQAPYAVLFYPDSGTIGS